jgi:hypothetical protein
MKSFLYFQQTRPVSSGPTLEDWQLPAKYRRRPIDDSESEYFVLIRIFFWGYCFFSGDNKPGPVLLFRSMILNNFLISVDAINSGGAL